ncbi:MAG: hypothetical protein Q9P44_19390 [Anaerolineae bacterium]|nr:hypothetical protein [Anaerolineae bacterium]
MTEQNNKRPKMSWKTQTYMLGAFLGAAIGFLSAYFFAQEAEENTENDECPKVPPSTMLGLALSAISLVRQISEVGKKEKKK